MYKFWHGIQHYIMEIISNIQQTTKLTISKHLYQDVTQFIPII